MMHIIAYNQKFNAHPRFSLMEGKVKVREKFPIHSETAARDIAAPLMRLGNISDKITQTIGASVNE